MKIWFQNRRVKYKKDDLPSRHGQKCCCLRTCGKRKDAGSSDEESSLGRKCDEREEDEKRSTKSECGDGVSAETERPERSVAIEDADKFDFQRINVTQDQVARNEARDLSRGCRKSSSTEDMEGGEKKRRMEATAATYQTSNPDAITPTTFECTRRCTKHTVERFVNS